MPGWKLCRNRAVIGDYCQTHAKQVREVKMESQIYVIDWDKVKNIDDVIALIKGFGFTYTEGPDNPLPEVLKPYVVKMEVES